MNVSVCKTVFWRHALWVLHDVQTFPMDPEAAMKYQKVIMQVMQYEYRQKHPQKSTALGIKTPTYLPMLDLVFSITLMHGLFSITEIH